MKTIGNVFWLLFGGVIMALLWALAGLLCCVTILMIPVGLQCFKIAVFGIWPFGRVVEYGGNVGHFLLNVLWLLLFGWELALSAVVTGALCCVTIIGIPFGLQHFKFAQLALMPFGAKIVPA